MPRSPDERIDKAFEMYKQGMKLVEIASQLNIPEGTVRSWKNRYKWDSDNNATLQKNECNVAKRNRGGQPGNKNAVGNKGGAAPAENKNAEKHGLFSKYLPEETMQLIENIKNINPIDLLWDQIMIQYAAIIRAQKIMHVTGKDEMIKELKKEKEYSNDFGSGSETEWEFQFAWDRQATFLTAQSRAMAELRNMIKQYDELLKSDLATDEQKARIEKLKAEVDRIKQDKGENPSKVVIVDDIEEGEDDGS